MAPLVRRTWAPQGETPILAQRTRARDKVSAVGVLTVSPHRRRLGLYVALYPDANINGTLLVQFLQALCRHLRGPLVLLWDRLPTHRAKLVQEFLCRHPRIHLELFPPYAPELNPMEFFWAYLKGNPLANHAPADAMELAHTAIRHTRVIAGKQSLLRSFLRASELPLRL